MSQDRFTKAMLVVIAVLLAANLLKDGPVRFDSDAVAQSSTRIREEDRKWDVRALKGYTVAGLREVVAVGDGKSFVVSAPDKFMVYQVDRY